MNYLSSSAGKARARSYWEQLRELVPVESDWVALDFGCGLGHILREMSRGVKEVYGIDCNGSMVRKAKKLTKDLGNVTVNKLMIPPPVAHIPKFDLISATSVVHYLSDSQLVAWISWWLNSLSARGWLVIANLPPRHDRRLNNLYETLKWGWKNHCLWGVSFETGMMGLTGALTNHHDRSFQQIKDLFGDSGLEFRKLSRSLEMPTCRYSIIIRKLSRDGKNE